MLRFTLRVSILFLACCTARAQQVSPHAHEAVQTIRELRAIGVPEPDDLEKDPPPKIPGLLRQLNHQLLALVIDTLNDSSRHTGSREEEITAQLQSDGWEEIPDHKLNASSSRSRLVCPNKGKTEEAGR
jgi:hypothetical protein